jgi:TRAP-type C4-dicarboxylate transport system permease small subunit
LRAALDWLYRGAGVLAGVFLVCIAAMTLAQIGGRMLGFAARSYDDFAGFAMAASFFLGLAWTMRSGEHIRVTLLVHNLKGRQRHAMEIAALVVSTFLCGYFAWYTVDMSVTSYELNDVSQGLVAVPLWLPQSAMALGLVVLTIALIDDLIVALRGRAPSYELAEAAKAGAAPVSGAE